MEERVKEVSEFLKVIANQCRLIILCNLITQPMTVSELHAKISNISQPALSQHLALLKAHHIVDCEKNGLRITYFMIDERVKSVIDVIKENYCPD